MHHVSQSLVFKIFVLIGLLGLIGPGITFVGLLGQTIVPSRPELHPVSLALIPPSPVPFGQRVQVKTMIENRGPRGVSGAGPFSVGFYYRLVGDPQWTLFTQERFDLGLKANEMAERTVEFQTSLLKDRLAEKSEVLIEVRVLVDFKSEVEEQDERNNQLIAGLSVRTSIFGLPDLSPVNIRFECASLPPGGQPAPTPSISPCPVVGLVRNIDFILITTNIANLGDTVYEGSFTTHITACRVVDPRTGACAPIQQRNPNETFEEDAKGSETVETIERQIPGERYIPACSQSAKCVARQVSFPVALKDGKTRPAGTYRIEVQVSPKGVKEMDMANNTLVAFYTLAGPELRPTSLEFRPSVLREHGSIDVFVTVINEGSSNVETPFDVQFTANGKTFADVVQTRLNVGEPMILNAKLEADKAALKRDQIITIQVMVDPNNTVSELDETNNIIESKLTVLEAKPQLAELHPKALLLNPLSPVEKERLGSTFPQFGQRQIVRLTAQILNTGSVRAENVHVCFAYRATTKAVWQRLESPNCAINNPDPPLNLDANMPADSKGVDSYADLNVDALNPGSYEIRAVVDPPSDDVLDQECKPADIRFRGQIAELDECNNQIVTHMLLLAPIKPDLRVSSKVTPLEGVNFGSPFTLKAIVTNEGDDLVNIPFKVQFTAQRLEDAFNFSGLQPPPLPQVLDTKTIFASKDQPFLPGQSREVTITVATGETPPLTPGVPFIGRPGGYNFVIVVDPDNVVDEQDETNNTTATAGPAPVGPVVNPNQVGGYAINGPDLAVNQNGICVRPAATPAPAPTVQPGFCNGLKLQYAAGESFSVTVDVQNIGVQIARSYNVQIRLCRGQTQCDGAARFVTKTVAMPPLENGRMATTPAQEFSTKGLSPGNYQIVVDVDPPTPDKPFGNVLEQLEKLNNTSALALQITAGSDSGDVPPIPPPPPSPCVAPETPNVDLRVSSLQFNPDVESIARAGKVQVLATVQNCGGQSVPNAFQVQFGYRRVDSSQIVYFSVQTVQPLGPVQATTIQADFDAFTLDVAPGDYDIIVTVDTLNEVREDDKNNNQAARRITVRNR
ncbi:hypothetical protein HYR54_12075 [Candidatus Acetothermia bacterium]|nr:hypothetical protein [Candidatus Acetothermia bacterium]MBI3660477.1 hypothetical protein [Candidatus Acetothermia bacterium]